MKKETIPSPAKLAEAEQAKKEELARIQEIAQNTGALNIDAKAIEHALNLKDSLVGYDGYVFYVYNTEHIDAELIPLVQIPSYWTSERTGESFLLTRSTFTLNMRHVFVVIRGFPFSVQASVSNEDEIKKIIFKYQGDYTPSGIRALCTNMLVLGLLGQRSVPAIYKWSIVLLLLVAIIAVAFGMYAGFNPVNLHATNSTVVESLRHMIL